MHRAAVGVVGGNHGGALNYEVIKCTVSRNFDHSGIPRRARRGRSAARLRGPHGHDEYGAFLGVVTSADILESIVGGFLVRSRICRGCG